MSDPVPTGDEPGADGLVARLGLRRDGFVLDLALEVPPGGVLALLGPNGAGKTTTLRLLAGLLAVDRGSLRLDGRLLDDPGTGRWVPPQRRPLGMVFQDYLLFGHLDARDNVAFGLRARGVPRRVARSRAEGWLERLGLGAQARTRPAALSGGQAQRVALARALAVEPRLLLLDEPLAALDASTRLQVRGDLRRHLADYPGSTVLVTHDPLEAMVLSDRLAVLEEGRLVQQGTPVAVARSPRTDYVARLVGLNLYRGRARGGRVELDGGGTLATAERRDGPVFVAFPPSAVSLHRRRPEGSPRNVWPGRVDGLEQHGETARVSLVGSPPVLADVTAGAVADLGLGGPDQVWASVKATEIRCYPA